MEMMGFFLLVVFSVLFAMGDTYLSPRFLAYPKFQRFQGSYAGRTGVRAASVLLLLVGVSFVMSIATSKRTSLPSA